MTACWPTENNYFLLSGTVHKIGCFPKEEVTPKEPDLTGAKPRHICHSAILELPVGNLSICLLIQV